MSIYYKIKLRPLEPYFFGQELSAELGNRQSYFQRSALFPQQTSILGMLRYQLLLLKGLIPLKKNENHKKAAKLIGEEGFRVGTKANAFGKIQKLSPVLLSRQEEEDGEKKSEETIYILRNKEVVKFERKNHLVKLKPTKQVSLYRFGDFKSDDSDGYYKSPPYRLELDNKQMYLAKYPFQSILHAYDYKKLTAIDCSKKLEELDGISHSDTRVGIYKNFKGETEIEGYYKKAFNELSNPKWIADDKKSDQKYYKRNLKENWSFVLYAQFSEEVPGFEGKNRPVTLGKEQSTFSMTVEMVSKIEKYSPPLVFEEDNHDAEGESIFKVILLSDAYISSESELYKKSLLVNAETKFFRHLKTSVNEKRNYYNIPAKSDLFNLLQRGGVIYTKQPKEIAALLKKETAFRNIGYNYFKIEKN